MRSMWTGAISFGMVAIPVSMYKATETKGISFNLLCPRDGAKLKQKRWCPTEDCEVPWSDTARGYEVAKNEYVRIEDAELEAMPLGTQSQVEILAFVGETEVNASVFIEEAYYLEPSKVGIKPFALLRRGLLDTHRVAIAKVAMRSRERLCRIAVQGPGLVLNTLHWPDEIRDQGDLTLPADDAGLSGGEVEMAHQLIENLTVPFDPAAYKDGYRDAVMALVDAKVNNQPAPTAPTAEAAPVVDLMAALKASVKATAKPTP
jgi:DNA end-binding protein Ku